MFNPIAQQAAFCKRCGAAGHDAVTCYAENDRVYAYRLYRQGRYGSQSGGYPNYSPLPPQNYYVPPHPIQQQGFQKPSFSFPPQQVPPSTINKEEIAELKSLVKMLVLQVQEYDKSREAYFKEFESQIAQLAGDLDFRHSETVYAICTKSGLSYEGVELPIDDDDMYDLEFEDLVENEASYEDFCIVQQQKFDRTSYSVRSKELYEGELDLTKFNIRSNSLYEENLDRTNASVRSSSFGEETSRSCIVLSRSNYLVMDSVDLSFTPIPDDDKKVIEDQYYTIEGNAIPFIDPDGVPSNPSVKSYIAVDLTPPPQFGSKLEEYRFVSSYTGLDRLEDRGGGFEDSIPRRKKAREKGKNGGAHDAVKSRCSSDALLWRPIVKIMDAEGTAFSHKPCCGPLIFVGG
ncbi:uncharacterized protein LOC141652218 [Silene latifolia]|uniref:uncharacterized protein LOC141652218 n=1 Tax=Silene latifolia TaxID=37657 RepID=UPI003D7791AF